MRHTATVPPVRYPVITDRQQSFHYTHLPEGAKVGDQFSEKRTQHLVYEVMKDQNQFGCCMVSKAHYKGDGWKQIEDRAIDLINGIGF
jgi:hypothetical protein